MLKQHLSYSNARTPVNTKITIPCDLSASATQKIQAIIEADQAATACAKRTRLESELKALQSTSLLTESEIASLEKQIAFLRLANRNRARNITELATQIVALA